jgi:hypothetical protein
MTMSCSAQRYAPRKRRHGATAFHAMDLRVAPEYSERHRPKSCKYGYFQIDTWPDSTSGPLMFEGMDLKCGVVN